MKTSIKLAVYAALTAFAFSPLAHAGVTIPSGSVLTSDGQVVEAGSTQSVQNEIARDGYSIAAGHVHINVGDLTVSIPMNELAGKTKDQAREVMVNYIIAAGIEAGGTHVTQTQDIDEVTSQAQHAVELAEEGIDAVIANGMTVDQLIDSIDHNADIGAIIGATQDQIDALNDYYESIDGQRPTQRDPQSCDPNC